MSRPEHCRDLLDSLSDYVDGTLGDELCEQLERHMLGCEDCRIVVDTLRRTISLYHASAVAGPIPAEVRERLYKRLDLEEFLET